MRFSERANAYKWLLVFVYINALLSFIFYTRNLFIGVSMDGVSWNQESAGRLTGNSDTTTTYVHPKSSMRVDASNKKPLPASPEKPKYQRVTGHRYMIGCDIEEWRKFNYRPYGSVFDSMIKDFGWKDYAPDRTSAQELTSLKLSSSEPMTLLFCEGQWKSELSDSLSVIKYFEAMNIKMMKDAGIKLGIFNDNARLFNKFTKQEMKLILETADFIVGPYAYNLERFFDSMSPLVRNLPEFVWIPHAASEEFTAMDFEPSPEKKILLTGTHFKHDDPVLDWLYNHHVEQPPIETMFNDYQVHDKFATIEENASSTKLSEKMNKHMYSLTTTSTTRRLNSKIFEIPATGSLLLVDVDLEDMLQSLGMINGEHYIGYSASDPLTTLAWITDEANAQHVAKVRQNGRKIVKLNHQTIQRAEAMDAFLMTGTVFHPMPKLSKQAPCPVVGLNSEEQCLRIHEHFLFKATDEVVRDKYLVGCSPVKWRSFVRPQPFFLFSDLVDTYEWKLIEDVSEVAEKLLQADVKPAAILFCQNNVQFDKHSTIDQFKILKIPELRRFKVKVGIFIDNTHLFNRYSMEDMKFLMRNSNAILGTYAYRYEQFLETVDLPKDEHPEYIWIPHSTSPNYLNAQINEKPIRKILISGHADPRYYPIRAWLSEQIKKHSGQMVQYKHPGYQKQEFNQSDIYATEVRAYYAAASTTLIYRRLVSKTFEIPSTGSLLFMNLDLEPIMEALGFQNMKHYVGFNDSSPDQMLNWVLSPENYLRINEIRKRGMDLVRSRHKVTDRSRAIDRYFTEHVPTYKFPKLERDHPCPMVHYKSFQQCMDAFNQIARHFQASKGGVPKPLGWKV